MLPLRSVGRSNFVRVLRKFNNVDSKATYFNENCCIIYIYIYIYDEKNIVLVLVPRVDSDK